MEKASAKQNDVLRAAIEEFAHVGLMGTTMEHIAKRAQVSKRTLYKHFASKEALFDEVVRLLLARIEPLHLYPYRPEVDLLSQLKELAHMSLKLSGDEDYMTLSRIVIIESMRSKEEANRLNNKFGACEHGLSNWFAQAEQAGALGQLSAEVAAAMFYGGLKKLAYWDQAIKWQPAPDKAKLDKLIDQCCRFFVAGLKGT